MVKSSSCLRQRINVDGTVRHTRDNISMQEESLLRIIMISFRMSGHSGASGYDRLQDFIDNKLITNTEEWTFSRRAVARVLRFMVRRSGSMWYHRANLLSELNAANLWFRHRGQLFHFLYGENSYRYLGNLKRLGPRNVIVSTYHTSPDSFREVVHNKRHLTRLDAAIVVSTVQMELLSGIIGPERVFYVPHGIDVEYFKPKAKPADGSGVFRCLFVGSYLRDIETLVRTAGMLESNRTMRFSVVTRPDLLSKFEDLGNVDTYAGVGDDRLLALYQEADLFVFPLLDCTANNSLLEAMACGLPIVTTDLPGVKDYVDNECAILVQRGDAKKLSEAVTSLSEDAAKRDTMSRASRRRALDFRWETVADQTKDVYRTASAGAI